MDQLLVRNQKPVPVILPNNQINYSIYTLYAGSWGYYSYDRNTKADAIRGRQTELPDVFVSGKNKKIRK